MNRLLSRAALVALVLCTACVWGCQIGDEVRGGNSPTEVPMCTNPAPQTVGARVVAAGCVSNADGSVTCDANYSLPTEGTAAAFWRFTGSGTCTPADSDNASGTVSCTFLSPLPQRITWEASRCTCSASSDPTGDSCRSTSGSSTFTSGA